MINIKVSENGTEVSLEGMGSKVAKESMLLVYEGFKILYEISPALYRAWGEEIFKLIITGELTDYFKQGEIERKGFRIDFSGLRRQVDPEGGDS